MAFRGLQAESVAQAKIHENASNELATLVLDPFAAWAQGYKVCRPSSFSLSCSLISLLGPPQAKQINRA